MIVPEVAVLVNMPIAVGVVKDPVELDSCAVKMLPAKKVPPELLNETETAVPVDEVTQNGEPTIALVVIVGTIAGRLIADIAKRDWGVIVWVEALSVMVDAGAVVRVAT